MRKSLKSRAYNACWTLAILSVADGNNPEEDCLIREAAKEALAVLERCLDNLPREGDQ